MIDDIASALMRRRSDCRMRREPISLTSLAVGLGSAAISAGGAYAISQANKPKIPGVRQTPDQANILAQKKREEQESEQRGRAGTILSQDSNAAGSPTYVNQTFGS